jgi:hypothetical protein
MLRPRLHERHCSSRQSWQQTLMACALVLLRVSARPDVDDIGRSTPSTSPSFASTPLRRVSFCGPRPSPFSPCQKLRGGSATPPRFPPSVLPSPGQKSPFYRSRQRPSDPPFQPQREVSEDRSNEGAEGDAASAKEMIDAFLTRDSRNTFIGAPVRPKGVGI